MLDGAPRAWFTAAALAGLPGMATTERGVQKAAARSAWISRERSGRGGGREYSIESLPPETQAALLTRGIASFSGPATPPPPTAAPLSSAADSQPVAGVSYDLDALQMQFDRAPDTMKAEVGRKQRACMAIGQLVDGGQTAGAARLAVSVATNVPAGTLKDWWYRVCFAPRGHWQLLLLDAYAGRTATVECPEEAYDWYVGQYLTRRRPTHADTYRRLQRLAEKGGWTLPSAKTLQRLVDSRVSRATQVLMRDGPEALGRMFPGKARDKSCFAAGQAVNGDGLKFDKLWVKFPDGEILNTATAWFWQDLHSGKVLAWRAGKTENTDLFRLSVWDLTAICLPEHVWVDNTTVAANKAMTAGAGNRHRFKDQPDDLTGALVQLGMWPHFTNPDQVIGNPGSKPIERAFGIGGIHDAVATNPRLINTGFSKATAIDFGAFQEVLKEEVARLNAQPMRRSLACNGQLSFDQAWEKSHSTTLQRRATEAQRRILLLMPEVVTVNRRNSVVAIQAGRGPQGQNTYWCEQLAQHQGEKVVVYYDPENLSQDVAVYTLDARYLFQAQHMASEAFLNTTVGREHGKEKRRFVKATKLAATAATRMSAMERAARYAQSSPPAAPPADAAAAAPPRRVVAGHFKGVIDPQRELQRAAGQDFEPAAPQADNEYSERFIRTTEAWAEAKKRKAQI